MNISLVYLGQRALYRIWLFIKHWYIGGFVRGITWHLAVLEQLDRFFALKITFRYLFQPLYRDYTVIGYLFGFLFRSIRIISALIIYALFAVLSLMLYLGWASIPLLLTYRVCQEILRI